MPVIEDVYNERVVQYGIAERLATLGWMLSEDETLDRSFEDVLLYSDLSEALVKLNTPLDKPVSPTE